MEENVEQNKSKSHKEFEKLLTEDLNNRRFKENEITIGTIEEIGKKFVFIDLGLKSSGAIPIEEFKLTKELDKISVGAKIEVLLEKIENKNGEIVVSREKARRTKSWNKLKSCLEKSEEVDGEIVSKTKGGAIVDIDSVLAFLPGSQTDIRPLKSIDHLIRVPQKFLIVKIDSRRGNVIVSRRAILEKSRNESRAKRLEKIKVGDVITGIIKNVTSFGAFVDLNGVDALLHITDISYSRIDKPSDLLDIGQTIKCVITKIEDSRVSVSLKDMFEDPYKNAIKKYKAGQRVEVTISKTMDYGVFATLEEGLEGLCHQSHMSHTKKNIHPNKVVSTSEKVQMEILEIDVEKRRIGLSLKACLDNPWDEFKKSYKVNDDCEGILKNITDYAVFANIKGTELDGMCHVNNLSWSENPSELDKYKKKQILKFKILEIDETKHKIRLGVRELQADPFDYWSNKKEGDIVTVTVDNIDNKLGVYVYAKDKNFSLLIKKNQLAKDVENQKPRRFIPSQKVDAKIIELQKEKRKVTLSIKKLEEQIDKETVAKYGSSDSGGVLGDILSPLLKKKAKTKKK